jgi:peptidoglycan/xylan/chitin deacetylase (PgdA/CDA1 family)
VSALRPARTARLALKAAAAGVDLVVRPPAGFVVLLYHRVGAGSGSPVDLPVDLFRRQLEALAEHAEVVRLPDALDLVAPAGDGSPRVVLTFDDGTADLADTALPLLVEFGFPATLYLATRWVDEGRSFWDDGTVLSWAALGDMVSTGLVSVGSHTHSHALLDRLAPAEVGAELDRSCGLIAEHLGVEAADFAYPKALAPSAAAEQEVRARFRSAALAGTRPNPYGRTDPFRVARSPVQVGDGVRWFRRKAVGGMHFEDTVRELVNRRRYAGATS